MRWPRVLGVALVVGWYLGVTLLLPLLNGAAAEPGFAQHARVTVGVTLGLSGLYLLLAARKRRAR